MSLAFDKQGKPFAWHTRTAKLRVRMFRNPSARGTCCQVLDGAGDPLYVDAEIDYAEFRRAIRSVPGLYRLDQCDEDGVELDDAPPAYVSIDQTRNASTADGGGGEVNPLVIIERLVATQAEVMKAMAAQHGVLMAASAEIMRAPYRPAPPPAPAAELRNAASAEETEGDDDDEDHDEDHETDVVETSPLTAALRMIEPHLPQLGAFLYHQIIEFLRRKPGTPAPVTAAPVADPVTDATHAAAPTTSPAAVVPATDSSGVPAEITVEPEEAAGESASDDSAVPGTHVAPQVSSPVASVNGTTSLPPPSTGSMDVGAEPMRNAHAAPTPEQLSHLFAVRARLSPKERAIAENALARMDAATRAHWLAELSGMSVEDAAAMIRDMVEQLPRPRGNERR
jgi:hypothetical protein